MTKSTTMKSTYYIQIISSFCLLLMLSSCSSEAELNIQDSEIDKLTIFVDEANIIAQQYEDLEGPKGSEIFGNNKSAVCGSEHVFEGPCIWAIDDIVKALGYRDIDDINKWMLDAGDILNKIRKNNKDFETDSEFINEVACLIAPEILTRSKDNTCYKDNLVALMRGALDGGKSHRTNYFNNNGLTKEEMYMLGSSFYKVWRYMIDSSKCN